MLSGFLVGVALGLFDGLAVRFHMDSVGESRAVRCEWGSVAVASTMVLDTEGEPIGGDGVAVRERRAFEAVGKPEADATTLRVTVLLCWVVGEADPLVLVGEGDGCGVAVGSLVRLEVAVCSVAVMCHVSVLTGSTDKDGYGERDSDRFRVCVLVSFAGVGLQRATESVTLPVLVQLVSFSVSVCVKVGLLVGVG